MHVTLWRSGDLVGAGSPFRRKALRTPTVTPPPLHGRPRVVVSRTPPPSRSPCVTRWTARWSMGRPAPRSRPSSLSDIYVHAGDQYEIGTGRAVRCARRRTARRGSTAHRWSTTSPTAAARARGVPFGVR